jgi:hypothetical protein
VRGLVALLVVAGVHAALAHEVTIVPSRCPLADVAVATADGSRTAAVAPAGDADVVRLVWDTPRDGVQLQARDLPARSFTVDGVAGSLALPIATNGSVTSGGDVVLPRVAVAVALGGASVTTRVTFTTGLATGADVPVAGTPLDAGGAFALVGVVGAGVLPPPLDAAPVVVRLGCVATPAPDLDQLGASASLASVGGTLSATGGHVRARLLGSAAADALALARGPAAVRLDGPDGVVASVVVPAGLVGDGARTLVGDAGGGGRVALRQTRHGWKVVVDLPRASAARGRVDVVVTATLGGVIARGKGRLHVRGGVAGTNG